MKKLTLLLILVVSSPAWATMYDIQGMSEDSKPVVISLDLNDQDANVQEDPNIGAYNFADAVKNASVKFDTWDLTKAEGWTIRDDRQGFFATGETPKETAGFSLFIVGEDRVPSMDGAKDLDKKPLSFWQWTMTILDKTQNKIANYFGGITSVKKDTSATANSCEEPSLFARL